VDTQFLFERGWINLGYLIASVLFIFGIKGLTHPRTAVRGNMLGAMGMLMAILVTLMAKGLDFGMILGGIVVGGAIGAVAALRVQMTAMPEMVAIFNGFGGAASTLVAGAALLNAGALGGTQFLVATGVTGLIGTVTFTGSMMAWNAPIFTANCVP
jgi:NAD(P) transhydrogenase subunit beta